jgi:hypothetical protein
MIGPYQSTLRDPVEIGHDPTQRRSDLGMDDCGLTIQPRDGVNPEEGIRQYGDVDFADPVNNKYPVDTPEHIHAAWSYIHHERDAAFYSPDDVSCIERRIREAAATQGITLGE